MTSLSEAFAGFAKTFTGEDAATTPQTAHGQFIHSQVLPLTAKLQREIRGRRYKEEQTKLQEAILVLRSFQNEDWPPRKSNNNNNNSKTVKDGSTHSVPKSIDATKKRTTPARQGSGDTSLQGGATTDDDELEENIDNASTLDESGITSFVEGENDDVAAGDASAVMVEREDPLQSITDDDQNTVMEHRAADRNTTSVSSSALAASIDDDPLTREPMHDAIILLLEALMKILHRHPVITNKACEISLDGVTLLVKRGYVSGRAGGINATQSATSTTDDQQQQPSPPPSPSRTAAAKESATTTTDPSSASPPSSSASTTSSNTTLLHRLLESIAAASSETTATEGIQTAVLKAFQTIVTSPKCGVHEASMLLALRSTFHVYLVTKSMHCKTAAKQALLDMLRSVFSRMEAYDAIAKSSSNNNMTGGGGSSSILSQGSSKPNVVTSRMIPPSPPPSPLSTTEVATPTGETTTGAHDPSTSNTNNSNVAASSSFLSQYHTDSYVLFRALCKLSSKELPVDNENEPDSRSTRLFNTQIPATDPLALNSKILSLELILSAMDFCGDAFCQGERFIYLVQHYLCVSLLKNCMSNQTQVAFLSQKIFLVLVYKFKGHLKQEIEVFLSNIFLRVLDSPNSSFKQKALVLESLRSLCRDPSLLTQIFLNYDCDFDAMNLYKEIVHMLTKLGGKATAAPNPSTTITKKDAEQDFELSLAGIEVLVTILKAMLRALGLPGGSGDEHDDKAGARIRGMLHLDAGLAAAFLEDPSKQDGGAAASSVGAGDSVIPDDFSIVDREQAGVPPTTSAAAPPNASETPSADAASSSDVAGKIVDAFEMKRNAEQNFEIGAVKFTLSLKSGLKFFIENGFVQCDAREFALFFLANKDKLDKTQMGEALGREPDAAFIKEKGVESDKGGPGFWVRILHHYVDALDFTGLVFDDGIRLFLSGFRLPGEAQKIDRIMEKFAEKFTSQNPDVFPSADTAFILAFSVIMLNTDLHNPSIKPERRMTIESFIRNNRGIGENGGDLPDEMLEGIFNRIKERPFSLKEDDAARERASTAQKQIFDTSLFFEGSSFFGTSAEQRKRETFKKEKDELMAVTEQLIRRRPEKNAKIVADPSSKLTDTVAPADVVKPMFDVTWGPMLGILSQVLECSDDEGSVAVCLNGFVYAVRIASHSNMSLARDTFVSSLAKFTFLGSIKEMKKKNVESVRTLLSIAVIDGEYLDESWEPVLQCISQLARLRLSASGLDSDESFLGSSAATKTKKATPAPSSTIFARPPSRGEIARETNENNGKAVLEAVQEVLIDKVFSSTVNLSAKSLARFIEQLIAVSESEIAGNGQRGMTGVDGGRSISSTHGQGGPSIYSLQRLVDVAFWNMDVRPRLVWAQVWEMMADFFATIACHSNAMVSVFAIDSLKQLSLKFLEKPELSEFNFQRIFLRPFLVVMEEKESREDVRELVLQCIDTIIRTKSRNLRSGWKVVFSILDRSASDPSEKIDFLGLAILQRLLDEHLHEVCSLSEVGSSEDAAQEMTPRIRNANADDFVELCRASLSFIGKEETDSPRPMGLSMRAFCHTGIYADLLASKRVLPPVSGAQCFDPNGQGYTYEGLSDDESLEMALWRPLLEGLAEGVQSPVRNGVGGVGCLVQRGSVLALRAILLRHGNLFSNEQWVAVLEQTLIPAIQTGAVSDTSPVVRITSEAPSVSSVDFLVEPWPLPPPPDDSSLQLFETDMKRDSKRTLGPAELMLEASFTDLRHGGDGDLRRAYLLARKGETSSKTIEQPFPDSWLATTAPTALGLLTDICSEIAFTRGFECRERLWPIIAGQYKLWCLGKGLHAKNQDDTWSPCEALVRISCGEVHRLASRLYCAVENLEHRDLVAWASAVLELSSDLISDSVDIENVTRKKLLRLRKEALGKRKSLSSDDEKRTGGSPRRPMKTPFGAGHLKETRVDRYPGGTQMKVNVIELDFGAVLFHPEKTGSGSSSPPMNGHHRTSMNDPLRQDSSPARGTTYWDEIVPVLKIRCIAAHCVHHSLQSLLDRLILLVPKSVVSSLLCTLNSCRFTSEAAVHDEHVAMAFKEALLSDWGEDDVDEVQEAIESAARLSHLHGSAMFFLTQEAGATKSLIRMLSTLYSAGTTGSSSGEAWDRESFAELHLFAVLKDVLDKFLESEEKDGYLIDPNVWRNASESGGKVALYCTSFASVVVEILSIIRSMKPEQFAIHKEEVFPRLCTLIRVQSDEIRELVREVLMEQVAPILGIVQESSVDASPRIPAIASSRSWG